MAIEQSQAITWYVGDHLDENPQEKEKFLRLLNADLKAFKKIIRDNTPQIIDLMGRHFLEGLKISYEGNFELFRKDLIQAFREKFLSPQKIN